MIDGLEKGHCHKQGRHTESEDDESREERARGR